MIVYLLLSVAMIANVVTVYYLWCTHILMAETRQLMAETDALLAEMARSHEVVRMGDVFPPSWPMELFERDEDADQHHDDLATLR